MLLFLARKLLWVIPVFWDFSDTFSLRIKYSINPIPKTRSLMLNKVTESGRVCLVSPGPKRRRQMARSFLNPNYPLDAIRRGLGGRMAEAEAIGSMKNLVAYIVQSLVDNPNSVSVAEASSGQIMVLELHVAKPDIGKVIGRQGRTAQAMRTIINAASAKEKRRAVLKIVE
jgi:predicted RNA-binding protein YlqC (UPF0109 family)